MEPQILNSVAWRYLPVEDLLHLCKTSRQFRMLCSNDSTWKFLFLRDFNVNYDDPHPQRAYFDYKYNVDAAKQSEDLIHTLDSKYAKLDYTFDFDGNKTESRDLGSEELTYHYYVKPLIISVTPIILRNQPQLYFVSFTYTLNPFNKPECGEGLLFSKENLTESNIIEIFRLFSMFKFLKSQFIDTSTGKLDHKSWDSILKYSGLTLKDLFDLHLAKTEKESYARCKKYNEMRKTLLPPPLPPRSRAFEFSKI